MVVCWQRNICLICVLNLHENNMWLSWTRRFLRECLHVNFIQEWNHPCLCRNVSYCLHVFAEMNSSLSKKQGWNFIPGLKKEKKTCKHFIPGWDFKMSMFFEFLKYVFKYIFYIQLTCLNIIKVWMQWDIRPLYKKWSPKRKRMSTTSKKSFLLFLLFSMWSLEKIEISFALIFFLRVIL